MIASLSHLWQRHRWLRFLITGGLNTGFSYGVYALLVYMGMNFALSNLCSLVLGILFSFRTQSALVFKNSGRGLFWRYVAVWVVLYFSNILMIAGLIRLGGNAYSAGAIAIFPTAVLSFFLQKYLVFPAKHGEV
ncbi:MAG: GtrA family protein [Pseudomonadota bacterium]|nr:GtrA family protein [Pseudomonadota bacterium]